MDVQLSISFLRARLGGAIEEAVRTAVETVLCETVRLLTGPQGDQQQGLSSATQRDLDSLAVKQRLEGSGRADWRAHAGSSGLFCNTGQRGIGGGRGNTKGITGQTTCSASSQSLQRSTVEPPTLDAVVDCTGLPDPFDLVSAGPVMVDFEEGPGMGIPEEWELMNRVYKTEHSEDMALIDEGATAHSADDHRLHEGDQRTSALPLEDGMSAKPEDTLHPCFSPANVKTEQPEMGSCCMSEGAPAVPAPANSGMEESEFGGGQVEAGPQDFAGRLRLWLEQLCPEVAREYEREGCLCELSRRKLIKFSVSFIVEEFGFYPTSAQKTMLAENIVELFPGLRLCAPSAGINGIEHLYDPLSRTGYIETRLRNSRRTLEAHKKKYVLKRRWPELGVADPPGPRTGPGPPESQSNEETQRWVDLMKRTRPLTRNLPAIHGAMDLTFNARRRWISNARPSMRDVLAEYPRFLDVPSTIDLEFERMFPGKGHSFLAQWSSFVLPRVYQITEQEKHPDISALLQQAAAQQGDSYTLTMLKVLLYVLPPTACRSSLPCRSSIRQAIRYLVDILPIDTKVSSLFCDPSSLEGPESVSHSHPYIVSVGSLDTPGRQLCILSPADRMAIPLPEEGLSNALDKLFKLLRVFELGYPEQLTCLYSFLEHLYGLEVTPRGNHDDPSGKRSKVLELLSRLHMSS